MVQVRDRLLNKTNYKKGDEKEMKNQLNPKRVALSLGIVSGIVSALCALLIAVAPSFIINIFGEIFHGIDISKITKSITLGGALLGTIEAIILAFIIGWLFAKVYNTIKE